jgi:cysteine synthase B
VTESMVPAIYDPNVLDVKVTIDDEEAFETARLLAAQEGLLVGMSSGAAVAGALRIAREMLHGVVVAILLAL